ncbi:MAG: nitrous oxide reductase family maturation protein NosD, partial [Pseudomonadota bacterium]|nr:nitrous oxide reductase family maturation protein NosD [Pseudomonadota bacterium]
MSGAQANTLQQQLDRLDPGATLVIEPGRYAENIVISKPVILEGNNRVILSGSGLGRVITVDAPDVTLSGLQVEDSGNDLSQEDAGIFVTSKGANAKITG